MSQPPPSTDATRVAQIVEAASRCAEAGAREDAWATAGPLLAAQAEDADAAEALARLAARGVFEREDGITAARALLAAHPGNIAVMGRLGSAVEELHDLRYLNAAPATNPVFAEIVAGLQRLIESGTARSRDEEVQLHRGLASAARILGRSWDEVAERSLRRRVELMPESWPDFYDLGLFFKTRGRFREGRDANQRAFELGGADDGSVLWNLGICATGAGDAETALRVWKLLGQRVEIGRFGLPEGTYSAVKVLLAQRPLAERTAAREPDDPGSEETIWAERLSPCHGVVRSALFQDLGLDYGDVILFDGAPITHHEYGGDRVPVFPHLATLIRPGYRIWPFGGTQAHAEQIASLSKALPEDSVLYVHTEKFQILCHRCWEAGRVGDCDHNEAEHRVVRGKLCAPPSVAPATLLRAVDAAVAAAAGVQVLVPQLAKDAGDQKRAKVEVRRMAMLSSD